LHTSLLPPTPPALSRVVEEPPPHCSGAQAGSTKAAYPLSSLPAPGVSLQGPSSPQGKQGTGSQIFKVVALVPLTLCPLPCPKLAGTTSITTNNNHESVQMQI